ncbi:biotin carboxylase N-terminal domain-containing protein [Amycolatopsis keratiniphila]|uniref:ATP-binding protein n=1 Tax=Amycolatopsis keratiniphila TaxID=129921 RepID=UPI00087C4128|nr:biotin carboxylase N-terminal domain-containing protein [Amycolatopsis keratiniphila]OLZ43196.1 acetyl/propionyl-CoA carboxylase subuit alpha [Amycolatopsis keratiniphila subsp. nogabecina]SDU30566.1 propionyl-CoA carboxylase alpha chain [Amycolatopsis keratiniphila]
MIEKLLVANRGEIARRVFRTCRDAGIGTVAVFSDADADAPHTAEADLAVRLPGNAPTDTYLRAELLIKAAVETGADAIHPGYGFLSENAAFARAVLDAGLTWVGPPPEAIESMGSKVESKRMMAEAGVPILSELDPAEVTEADLPLLVKASAGGGGRGMRVVRTLGELAEAVEGASAEAASAFGDPTVFCERYLETGRHIEVQVLADTHGTVWAVGERECSIQRRHQKVVEEAPSPFVDEAMREALFDAARKAAQAIDYVGAGTVEFLAGPDGRFYFLEMNTRLQVEHPVTEATTGLDLVSLQLRIAEGEHLPIEEPATTGHAIEVRLYAEDPAAGWQPQSGTLHRFELPVAQREFEVGPGVRLDSGFVSGQTVGVHYDPMLAKVIAYAPDRRSAARALAGALAGAEIHGVVTNRDLLVNVLRHEAFLAGETDTAFFDRHGLDTLARPLATVDTVRISALAAALSGAAANRSEARVQSRLPSGWRNVRSQGQRKRFRHGDDELEVGYSLGRDGLRADGFEGVELVSAENGGVVLEVSGVRRKFAVARYGDTVYVDSPDGSVELGVVPRYTDPDAALAAGSLVAPMPGTVVRLAVEAGDTVKTGDPLLWLEAMKMEHRIAAPADGVVTELPVVVGQQVEVGTILAVVGDDE